MSYPNVSKIGKKGGGALREFLFPGHNSHIRSRRFLEIIKTFAYLDQNGKIV